ncbi:MAG: hypothetical protein J07HQW2_02922 [Haloquadratum walsbyi J07HQW2]|uniref:Uncharacterized protein n=1 Tax=Haloquadratum walsbyi J07HQW2 TaxID=1238425 RepID=U1NHU5_9EURY|nr:MAG: hypothetical protein J07HQW2_02922 [Haloquadratum walsbyi J07HQW2]
MKLIYLGYPASTALLYKIQIRDINHKTLTLAA